MAILPREVAVAAPNWQNGLPAPLARDRGAPGTQRGHPDSREVLSSRLDQVTLRCWLDTSPPRRRDAPHARDAGAERARRAWVGLSTPYSAPSCLSPIGLFTWGQCSAASGRAAHYHALEQPAEPQHAPYVRAEGARVDHTARILHPRARGVHTERLRSRASDPCIPARPLAPGRAPAFDTAQPLGTTTHARCTPGGPGVAARSVATAHGPKDTA